MAERPFSFQQMTLFYTRDMNDCNCNRCDPCGNKRCADPCGCPMRVLSVMADPDNPGVVKFNLDGHTEFFDFSEIVAHTETDTFLRIDGVARSLKYLAEGHTNNISAKDLGSILHLGDLGDVDMGSVEQNSLLFYQKNSDCGQGCDEISNQWIAWNATENLEDAAQTIMGFDENDAPVAIQPPMTTDKYHIFGWRASDKAGYMQPKQLSTGAEPSSKDNYAHLLFENPNTHELEAMPVIVEIDGTTGVITLKTRSES